MEIESQVNSIKKQIEETKMEIETDIGAKNLNKIPKDIIRVASRKSSTHMK